MNADEHHDLQELLPWYVTGRLDADEHARVDAHVAGCAECQAEVRFQRRLEAEIARLPIDVEEGWSAMRERIAAESGDDAAPAPPIAANANPRTPRSAWLGWGVAAGLALVTGVTLVPKAELAGTAKPEYHALSSSPAPAAGNVIVIFRPDTTEAVLRETLRASHARVVDGPTTADAYVLSVAPAARDAALSTLRARREVVLAEAVDTAGAP